MKEKNYLKMLVFFLAVNFGLFLFPVAASANTAPKLDVIEEVTIASTYPLDLKTLILEASDKEDKTLGKNDVVIQKNGFTAMDDYPPFSTVVYNKTGNTYKVDFILKDSEGLETKKTCTINVVMKGSMERFHFSPNVLGLDSEHGETPTKTEVAYPLDYTDPFRFTFRYIGSENKKPVQGLHLSFRKGGKLYTGSLGDTYFITNAKGEYEFILTKEQLKEYAYEINKHILEGQDRDANLEYYRRFERYEFSIAPTAIYNSTVGTDVHTAHYLYPDGHARKFAIGLWGPKVNRIKFETIDNVYEIEEGSEFITGPLDNSARIEKAQTNLKKLAKRFEYLKKVNEDEFKWKNTLNTPDDIFDRPMFRVAAGSVDTNKPGDYKLTIQAGRFNFWEWQSARNEMGPTYYAEDKATVRVVAKPVVTFKETFKDKTEKKNTTVKVSKGTKVAPLEKPVKDEKDGKTVFMGWFKEDTFENIFNFDEAITGDTTVYGYWNHMPEITTKDVTITEGDAFELNKLVVSASDKEDGDLTANVEITDKGSFDNTKPGVYTITFKVTDKDGVSTTKTAKVTVESKAVVTFKETFKDKTEKKTNTVKVKKGEKVTSPESPKINDKDENTVFMGWFKEDTFKNAFDFNEAITADTTVYGYWNHMPELKVKDMTITEGDDFDLKSLIVSATDTEDGDLKASVEITDKGSFDKTKPGTYTVTFKVTDKDGVSTTKTATVTVEAKLVVTFKELFKDKTEKTTSTVEIKKGTKAPQPVNPIKSQRDGKTVFMGWFKEDTFENAFDFNEAITADTTVYGYWNYMPEIKVKDMTITAGDDFDLTKLLVSATDTEDGDLIDKVEIIDNGGFDKNNAGTYTITFKLTDKDGTTSVKTAKLTIKKKAEKANPEGKNKTTPNTGIESSINKQIDLYTIISIIFATLFVLSKTVIKEN